MTRCLSFLLALLLTTPLLAQTPAAPAAGAANVEVDPIRCWWRTSTGAVRIGETFGLSLTCAVLENETVQVVPDESRLGSAVIQMAPFEVVGGTNPADLYSGPRRFFQYDYTLRLISPDLIGKDVRIPDIVIHYRINSRIAADAAIQGRDLVYMMPTQSVRILSLVPADTGDIRDAQGESFATAENLTFRASVFEIVAVACIALGALMILIVLVRLARGARRQEHKGPRPVSVGGLAAAAARELGAVEKERGQDGWTPALVDRAMAATRLAAGCAIGHAVNQQIVEGDAPAAGEGRLRIPGGFRGKARTVSSSVTAADLARVQRRTPGDAVLEPLREALTAFAAAQYGRDGLGDQGALDRALSAAQTAAGDVRGRFAWWKTMFRQMGRRPQTAASRA